MNPLTPPRTTAPQYFPTFTLPSWFQADDRTREALRSLFEQAFGGIDRGAKTAIEVAFYEVLDLLTDSDYPVVTHRRFVTHGLILAMASQAWIRSYTPDDQRAARITAEVQAWLKGGPVPEEPLDDRLYPLQATAYQELDEDREVHRCLSLMPGAPQRCRQLLLDILDVTVDGFAVHPAGGLARRDLFHWWLCQAVPAAIMERLPDHIYSGDWPWPPRPPDDQSPSMKNT